MTALAYEQFELPWAPPLYAVGSVRCRIERVPSDPRLASKLQEYKRLREDGWDVTALLAPDSRTVLLMACRQSLLAEGAA